MFNFQSWSNEFFQQPTQPMNREQTTLFLNMLFLEQQKKFKFPEEITNQFLYKVIDSRANYIGLHLSEQAKVFLMFLTKSPGSAVMYLYAFRSLTNSVNMAYLAEKFPMGFLTEQAMSDMWDKQKGYFNDEKSDNCLDHYVFS